MNETSQEEGDRLLKEWREKRSEASRRYHAEDPIDGWYAYQKSEKGDVVAFVMLAICLVVMVIWGMA